MPKISAEAREQRRDEILEAARRCFATYGYEGATVVRLEQETGLSRGAIFNYFPSQGRDLPRARRARTPTGSASSWADEGLEAVIRAFVEEDPDWLGAYLEVRGADADRSPQLPRALAAARARGATERMQALARAARDAGEIRDDVPLRDPSGSSFGVVLDGLAVRPRAGFRAPDASETGAPTRRFG